MTDGRPQAMMGKRRHETNICQHRQRHAGSYCDPFVARFGAVLGDFLLEIAAQQLSQTGQSWRNSLDIAALQPSQNRSQFFSNVHYF